MKELTVFEHNHVDVVDSRQVAEMIGRRHDHLIRDIKSYCDILSKTTAPKIGGSAERNFAPSDFFIESTYKDSTGRTLPCYLLTKKGCDMVANKMTGEKGVLFTAAYVTAFEAMRKHIEGESKTGKLPKPMTSYQQMMAEKWERDHALQKARIYIGMAKRYRGTNWEQVLNAYATKSLSGQFLVPLPAVGERLLSAEEIGAKLGISANMVGRLTKQYNLKTDQYGEWFHDKSRYSDKQVPSFRYKECVVDKLREILKDDTNKED